MGSYFVSPGWLKNHIEKNVDANLVVVDTRFQLNDENAGRKAYIDGHIPSAIYLDLEKDLSGKAQKHGGNHPLPDIDTFVAKIGNIGIDNNTTVVIYDQANDMFAARLWWLLHYVGHEDVYLLDGGFDTWVKEGNPVTTDIPELVPKTFHPNVSSDEVVHIEDVKEKRDNTTLIDSRSKDRYLGKTEPLYKKAGHIPGAINYFWRDVLKPDGSWKTETELKEHFNQLDREEEIIVSCGSGVSACANILALKLAGYENVKLYPGSYSDWISYDENEVETEERNDE
ncbi:sulfurtransferase [Oceanobacillus halotolerans]|uniref:sulfurtransferase n=1 Tax=Oceanobacillus halotolerans TaxID=2663380 RepID=UPI0013DBD610|nr:sulfurtransferase [Oceanobacillus halotolerans]